MDEGTEGVLDAAPGALGTGSATLLVPNMLLDENTEGWMNVGFG